VALVVGCYFLGPEVTVADVEYAGLGSFLIVEMSGVTQNRPVRVT